MAAEFKIQRGTTVIADAAASATITAGTEYTAPASLGSAFIRLTNTGLCGMGRTSGGAQHDDNKYGVSLTNPANLLTDIDFTRFATASNCRATWEVLEYIGAASGPNEFIVRAQGHLSGSGNTLTGPTITTIANVADCVVFITGQRGAYANRAQVHGWKRTASLVANGSDWDPTFIKGGGSLNSGVSYAVVEFTGSNWSVAREIFTTTGSVWAPGDNVNFNVAFTTALAAVARTFLHVQFHISAAGQIQDCGDTVGVDSTTNMRVYNRATDHTRTKVVWVIENSDTDPATEMIVEHLQELSDTINQTEEWARTIAAAAVRALDETSVMGESSTYDGTATQSPNCAAVASITGTAASPTVELIECESNQERRINLCVVQWPRAAAAGGGTVNCERKVVAIAG